MIEDIYVHLSDEIPVSIGSAVAKGHGWYDIYISTKLTYEERMVAYLHEMRHISNGDLDGDCCVSSTEWRMR